MNSVAADLERLIDDYFPQLDAISEETFSEKHSPEKWSKKEILGHLIDSAQTNIRRSIAGQYENNPTINYDQEAWVSINNYQSYPSHQVVDLWYLQNKQFVNILKNLTPEMFNRTCTTQAVHTLQWLAEDYIRHLKHHMHVILDLEVIAYP